jgi:M6 family metalloprotease-like protein
LRRLRLLSTSVVLTLASLTLPVTPASAADPSGGCALPGKTWLSEGNTNYNTFLRPSGIRRAVVLFVDFADAPGSATPISGYRDLLMPAEAWFDASSFGKLDLQLETPEMNWVRMPSSSGSYGMRRDSALTFAEHKTFMEDAVLAANASGVDFSGYKLLYVVTPEEATNVDFSPAFIAPAGAGITVDGNELRWGATMGRDIWNPNWGHKTLVHETGHTFGLTDLYDMSGADLHGFVGGWDAMGNVGGYAPDYFGWHKWKLGWLNEGQTTCVNGAGQTQHTLSPVETSGGTEAVIMRTSGSAAYVVENRQPLGNDVDACDEGVLVYKVNSSTESGSGTIRLEDAAPASPLCGDELGNAPFDLGGDAVFQDASAGIKIEVLSQNGSDYTIEVTRDSSFKPPAVKHARAAAITGGGFSGDNMTFKGFVEVNDGYGKCEKDVPLKLQRYAGGWNTVKKGRTDATGKFVLRTLAKKGKWRVLAPEVVFAGDPKNVCVKAVAPIGTIN